MLDKHFIVKTEPIALEENVVSYGNYRITILTDRLFRVEYSENKEFCDFATSAVWYRNLPVVDYTVEKGRNFVCIATDRVELFLLSNFSKSYAVIDGKKLKLCNKLNLKGTFRTLDQYDGEIHFVTNKNIVLDDGIISRSGIAILDDSKSPILKEDGEFYTREQEELDCYIFAYGNDYREAIKAFFSISGQTPMLPRYVLGNWWSRYYAYSDHSYLDLLEKFEDNDAPLSVATIDMDWHYSTTLDEDFAITEQGKNTEFYGGNDGWTGYSWNKKLFADYKSFLQKVKDKNLKITLNVHPALGVRWFEDCYKEFAKKMDKDPEKEEHIKFDLTDSNFVNNYFKVIHRPYEKDGVDFWWIDWQQGNKSAKEGVDPLLLLNHYHYLDKKDSSGDEAVILSRYCGVGAHRYPLGFSGDTLITWNTLKFLPYFTATASNVGYGWWSHDIGGHYRGEKDDELYLRSVQFGVFSPILRLHSCNDEMMSKEPWNYTNGIGDIAIKWLKYRHSLIPFLYSLAYKCHTKGEQLIEPMYYYHDVEEAYAYKDQYYFGGLLVAPILTPTKRGFAKTKVWLPKGKWTDIFTGDEHDGDQEIEVYRSLDSIPVFAKDGQIIVRSLDKGNSVDNPKRLLVEVYNGEGSFTLYENDEKDELWTYIRTYNKENQQKVIITTRGKDVAPKKREVVIALKNVKKADNVTILVNDRKSNAEIRVKNGCQCVILNGLKFGAEYVINVFYTPQEKVEYVKDRACKLLMQMQGDNKIRNELYEKIKKVTSLMQFEKEINSAAIDVLYKKLFLSY